MTASRKAEEFVAEDPPLPGMIGEHPLMKQVYRLVRRVAPTDFSVLIVGETGTGKELVARALHSLSGRRGKFVAFNVAAIPETMVEDALFGHVKGAYTGAVSDSPGYLLEADGGTAFFDEVGAVSLSVQAKLLRAIEDRQFRPVGGQTDRRSDFRLVAATNSDLRVLAAQGRFRADLLERLHGAAVVLPPLRERMADVIALAECFAGRGDGPSRSLAPEAVEALLTYHWPGNVRELAMTIRRAALLVSDGVIDRAAVEAALTHSAQADNRSEPSVIEMLKALRSHGTAVAAARSLGIARSTLYERLRKAGVRLAAARVSGVSGSVRGQLADSGHLRHRNHQERQ
jgi:DNA-binding NtrC family response regulator